MNSEIEKLKQENQELRKDNELLKLQLDYEKRQQQLQLFQFQQQIASIQSNNKELTQYLEQQQNIVEQYKSKLEKKELQLSQIKDKKQTVYQYVLESLESKNLLNIKEINKIKLLQQSSNKKIHNQLKEQQNLFENSLQLNQSKVSKDNSIKKHFISKRLNFNTESSTIKNKMKNKITKSQKAI